MDQPRRRPPGPAHRRPRRQRAAPARSSSRSYPTPRGEVWDALTDPERIPRWFLPGHAATCAPGGRYQLEGNAGGDGAGAATRPGRSPSPGSTAGDVSWVVVTLTRGRRRHPARARARRARPTRSTGTQFGPGAVGIGWELALMRPGRAPGRPARRVDPAARRLDGEPGRRRVHDRRAATPGREAGIAAGDGRRARRAPRPRAASRRTPEPGGLAVHAFDVLGDPVRRRILELLAERRARRPATWSTVISRGVRDRPAGGVHAAAGCCARAASPTVRADGRAAALRDRRPAPLAEVDAWLVAVPRVLGAAARRPRHRDRPRPAGVAAGRDPRSAFSRDVSGRRATPRRSRRSRVARRARGR